MLCRLFAIDLRASSAPMNMGVANPARAAKLAAAAGTGAALNECIEQ
jgi:hypothetical protein